VSYSGSIFIRKFGHFDFMNVGMAVKLQPVDSEQYFENLPKSFSFRTVAGKSHVAISLNGQRVNLKTASTWALFQQCTDRLKCWRQRNVGVQNCIMLLPM
jgi:hypothetical protein